MVDNDMERFAVAMLLMYKAFNKPVDRDVTKLCFMGLKHITIEDAEQCISLAILNEERFPTPFALKRLQSLIPPRPVPRLQYQPFGKTDEKLAVNACKLVNGYLDGKLSRQALIEGMCVMDKEYPHMGWSGEAAVLTQFFRETPEGSGTGLKVTL